MKYRIKKIQGTWHIQALLDTVLYEGEWQGVWATLHQTTWDECISIVNRRWIE